MADHFDQAVLKYQGTNNAHYIYSTADPNDNDYNDVYGTNGKLISTIPVSQVQNNIFTESLVKCEATAPYSAKLSSPDSITFQIDRNKCPTIDAVYIDMTLTIATGTCEINIPRIFQRIDYIAPNGQVIRSLHPEDLLYFGKSYLSEASRKQILTSMGSNEKYEVCKYGKAQTVAGSPWQYFIYLPFPKEFPLCAINGNIQVIFYINSITTDWLYSGTLSYITLSRFNLMIKSGVLPDGKVSEIISQYKMKEHMRKYLTYPHYRESVTMTTSSATEYDIQLPFTGVVSALYIALRASKAAILSEAYGNGYSCWLEDSNNNRIYSSMDLNTKELINGANVGNRQGNALHDNTNIVKFNFASDEEKTEEQEINTGFIFMDSHHHLKIKTAASAIEVAQQQTLTVSATATAGYFSINYRNSTTGPLAFNVSSADATTSVCALQSVLDDDLKISVTSAISSATTILFVITNMKKHNEKYGNSATGVSTPALTGGNFSIVNSSLLATAAIVTNYSTLTVAGNASYALGNATGSSFLVDVFARKHGTLTINNGNIEVNDS
jgi:hypothetical protein